MDPSKAGSPIRRPTDPSIATALSKIRSLCDDRDFLQRQVHMKEMEIREAWQAVPPMYEVEHERPCRRCSRPTLDRFDGSPQCKKHVRDDGTVGDDGLTMTKIMEKLMRHAR
jgi:hypothetical protein